MARSLLKTVEGIDIFIDNQSGKFSAMIGRKEIEKRLLRDVEKEIEKTAGAVTAYDIDLNYPRSPHKVEIVGFEKERARDKEGRLLRRFDYLYILDLEQLERIEEIAKRYQEVKEDFQEYIETLPRLTSKNFPQIREAQKKANP